MVVVREGREKLFNLGFIEMEMLMEYTSGGNNRQLHVAYINLKVHRETEPEINNI